ncbi:MAG: hypothetical protein LBL87_05950 [Ruminococcus sp.]|jgi:DNA repair protein RadC|nr:hypothetical protein [Ruminococcus sp.]
MLKEELHIGHRDKMRRRLFEQGLSAFAPHEVVEMLLFYTIPRQNTNEMAHKLLDKFGSIGALFDAPLDVLLENGVSENTAALFKIIPQCLPIYYASVSENVVYDNPSKLKKLFLYQYPGKRDEELRLACFTQKLGLIDNHVYTISTGGKLFTEVNMRKIVETIIKTDASLVAISHNHPGGIPEPSKPDIFSTRNISRTLKSIDVYLLDHIIVGRSSAFSMREHNIIGAFD